MHSEFILISYSKNKASITILKPIPCIIALSTILEYILIFGKCVPIPTLLHIHVHSCQTLFIIFLKTVNFIDCEYHLIVLMSMFLISNKAQNNTS